ncbi:hypothetical protein HYV43_03760 [Candidatus Micrarchaeota archaeon]|nr:hypothetical protein [Candidatus Micrarchaeota archaeon]
MSYDSNCWEGKAYTGTAYATWSLPFSAHNVKFTVSSYGVNDGCERIIANGVTVVDRSSDCNYGSYGGLCKYSHGGYPGTTVDVIGPAVTMDIRYVDSFFWPNAPGGMWVEGTATYDAPQCAQEPSYTVDTTPSA